VSGGTASRLLNLGTTGRCVVSFTPQQLYLRGKDPRNTLDTRLGRPQRNCRKYIV